MSITDLQHQNHPLANSIPNPLLPLINWNELTIPADLDESFHHNIVDRAHDIHHTRTAIRQISLDSINRTIKCICISASDDTEAYRVSVTLSSEGEWTEFQCDCRHARAVDGYCKHTAAFLLLLTEVIEKIKHYQQNPQPQPQPQPQSISSATPTPIVRFQADSQTKLQSTPASAGAAAAAAAAAAANGNTSTTSVNYFYPSTVASVARQLGTSLWSCSMCSYDNLPTALQCKICQSINPQPLSIGPTYEPTIAPTLIPNSIDIADIMAGVEQQELESNNNNNNNNNNNSSNSAAIKSNKPTAANRLNQIKSSPVDRTESVIINETPSSASAAASAAASASAAPKPELKLNFTTGTKKQINPHAAAAPAPVIDPDSESDNKSVSSVPAAAAAAAVPTAPKPIGKRKIPDFLTQPTRSSAKVKSIELATAAGIKLTNPSKRGKVIKRKKPKSKAAAAFEEGLDPIDINPADADTDTDAAVDTVINNPIIDSTAVIPANSGPPKRPRRGRIESKSADTNNNSTTAAVSDVPEDIPTDPDPPAAAEPDDILARITALESRLRAAASNQSVVVKKPLKKKRKKLSESDELESEAELSSTPAEAAPVPVISKPAVLKNLEPDPDDADPDRDAFFNGLFSAPIQTTAAAAAAQSNPNSAAAGDGELSAFDHLDSILFTGIEAIKSEPRAPIPILTESERANKALLVTEAFQSNFNSLARQRERQRRQRELDEAAARQRQRQQQQQLDGDHGDAVVPIAAADSEALMSDAAAFIEPQQEQQIGTVNVNVTVTDPPVTQLNWKKKKTLAAAPATAAAVAVSTSAESNTAAPPAVDKQPPPPLVAKSLSSLIEFHPRPIELEVPIRHSIKRKKVIN